MEDNKDNKSIETESDEQTLGNELDELEAESDEQTLGDELDELEAESDEQTLGDELDELEAESDEQTLGDELDELEAESDEQGPIIELDDLLNESDEQTLENELDELEAENDEQEAQNDEQEAENDEQEAQTEESEAENDEQEAQTEESEAESKEENSEDESQKGIEKKHKGKKWLWLLIVTGLFSVSAAGGYFGVKVKTFFLNSNENIKQSSSAANSSQQQKPSQAVNQKEEIIEFKSFVIPFKQSGKFTYISLSIIFKLPDKKAKRKMILEKTWMRAMIYDAVKKKINTSEDTSSSQLLKTIIIKAVHKILPAERVNDFEIKDFQAV